MAKLKAECDRYISLMLKFTGEGMEPDKNLLEHIKSCDACRKEWARLQTIEKALSSIEVIEAPDDFTDSVMARLEEPLPELEAPPHSRLSLPSLWQLGAGGIIMFIFAYLVSDPNAEASGVNVFGKQFEALRALLASAAKYSEAARTEIFAGMSFLPEILVTLQLLCLICVFLLSRLLEQGETE